MTSSTPGTYTGTLCVSCSPATASASNTLVVSASGSSATSIPYDVSSGGSWLRYYYRVVGPSNVAVPVHIAGTLSTFATGPTTMAQAIISWSVSLSGNWTVNSFGTCSADNFISNCGSMPLRSSGTLDAIYNVTANANGSDYVDLSAGGISDSGGSFSAYGNSVVTIDKTFLAANPGYSLQFSPGVVAVPEPATYAMMLVGLGMMGFIARRNSRKA